MVTRFLRILIGFVAACIGAGITMVLFVLTPGEMSGLPPDVAGDRIAKGMELATYVAVQAAIFSAPLALIAVGLGEFWRNREWTFYVITALAITGLGFFAQYTSEQLGQPTIANNYALTAFLTAGFVGGFVYWLISGRIAGGQPTTVVPAEQITATAGNTAPAKE